MSWIAIAVGAGAGVLKAEVIDKPKENADRQLAAQTQRFAPWTGNKAGPIRYADPVGNALQFGMAAGSIKQGMNNGAASKGTASGLSDASGDGSSPWHLHDDSWTF